jgi:hypothetical protein
VLSSETGSAPPILLPDVLLPSWWPLRHASRLGSALADAILIRTTHRRVALPLEDAERLREAYRHRDGMGHMIYRILDEKLKNPGTRDMRIRDEEAADLRAQIELWMDEGSASPGLLELRHALADESTEAAERDDR